MKKLILSLSILASSSLMADELVDVTLNILSGGITKSIYLEEKSVNKDLPCSRELFELQEQLKNNEHRLSEIFTVLNKGKILTNQPEIQMNYITDYSNEIEIQKVIVSYNPFDYHLKDWNFTKIQGAFFAAKSAASNYSTVSKDVLIGKSDTCEVIVNKVISKLETSVKTETDVEEVLQQAKVKGMEFKYIN